jgi:hypothetical protein
MYRIHGRRPLETPVHLLTALPCLALLASSQLANQGMFEPRDVPKTCELPREQLKQRFMKS